MAKRMIIKGVGHFMAKRYAADGKGVEVITLGSLQDLKIDLDVQVNDIFGGDGLFAIDTLVAQKQITITATDAKFDLDALQLMMGSNVREQVANQSLWVLGEEDTAAAGTVGTSVSVAKVTADFGATLFSDGNFQVRLKDSNVLMNGTAASTTTAPADDEFFVVITAADNVAVPAVPGKAEVVLSPNHVGKDIVYSYQRSATVDVVDILKDEVPFPVHVIHHGAFLQKDGTFQGIETELYQCMANGTFTIDAARAQASTSQVTLRVLDPDRADKKLGSIKRWAATSNA